MVGADVYMAAVTGQRQRDREIGRALAAIATVTASAPTATPVAEPTAAPRPDGGVGGAHASAPLVELLSRYSWPVAQALRVVQCESGGNAAAYNAGNYGLFQINAVHVEKVRRVTGSADLSLLFDPDVNAAVAYIIWSDSGWGPWACRP